MGDVSKYSKLFYDVQKEVSKSFDNKVLNDNLAFKKTDITYKELEAEVRRIIELTRDGLTIGNTKHSLFIFGPTGVGKTEIIEEITNSYEDAHFHKLEIQKVPIEELQGFPYLHKNIKDQTVVRLAQPTVLPPSDDDGLWVLYLDEFNKADTDAMAAVMNLILTGELGGSADYDEVTGKSIKYKLPKRTVVIGAGNRKEQKGVSGFNVVNVFDTATAERWHRVIELKYNAPSWLENFAFKPYKVGKVELPTRIPTILMYYIFDKFLEEGNVEAPFLIPKKNDEEDENESTMSPRAWTLVANNMIYDMIMDYSRLPKNERPSFEEYYQDPNVQIEALKKNISEFGIYNGYQIVQDIIGRFSYFAKNLILPTDIVYNYKNIREKVKNIKDKKGILSYLLLSVAHYFKEIDNPTERDLKLIAVNISTFIADTEINVDDLIVFVYEINEMKKKFTKEINDFLYKINENYKETYQSYYYTGEQEIA